MEFGDAVRRLRRRAWVPLLLAALAAWLAAQAAPSAADRARTALPHAEAELVPAAATANPALSQLLTDRPPAQELSAAALVPAAVAARVALAPDSLAQAAGVAGLAQGALTDRVTAGVDPRLGSVRLRVYAANPEQARAAVGDLARVTSERVEQLTAAELAMLGEPKVSAPSDPVLPQSPGLRATGAGVAGLLVGAALAIVAFPRRSRRLRAAGPVGLAYGCPVLAEVPRSPRDARYPGYVAFLARPAGTVAEAYRVLRCAVLNRGRRNGDPAPQVIAVSSVARGEGRSSVAVNLAAALAEADHRVLLVDCDFGHPTAHFIVGLHPGLGLSDLLAEPARRPALRELLQPSEVPGVAVLSIGSRGGREPGALAEGLGEIVTVARGIADIVILDTEPLAAARDALDALSRADAVILVARAGAATADRARAGATLLDHCGIGVVGTVLVGERRETLARTPYLLGSSEPEHPVAAPAPPTSTDTPAYA